ncbi:hypothetical protein EYR40_000009 [Pleurotus pulmonarius]|nr:hypothetical protein EYR36_005384 [Pleurotus pulmonarius]KAF4590362.1 hypothetical protein EYR38_009661 [Pleurotus pulmonarius]KAF4590651.1 hypothetical protein EYR40_009247 [Pleurotus pulmonarius]KAF4602869.1 hypothetical protein EYR38_003273 [Pleurotus pulmonarius]KAF4607674.1 hypothetical protein EYR40_000009 [Pleurotus pulmonarius]
MLIHDAIMQLPRDPRLTLAFLHDFIRLASLAQPFLTFHQKPSTAPIVLPTAITSVLSGALECNAELVQTLWGVLKDEIWSLSGVVASDVEIKKYNEFALAQGTYCNTRYYHNYCVNKSESTRTYYGGLPDILQVAEHFFLESALMELLIAGQVFGWVSATNWARIYDYALAPRSPQVTNNAAAFATTRTEESCQLNWQSSLHLRADDVLNGFFLYSLLLDKAEHGWVLVLGHDKRDQAVRLRTALEERNQQLEGIGQENYTHASKCALDDCEEPSEARFRTCANPDHRKLEGIYFNGKGKAVSQLQSRLKKAGLAVSPDSASLNTTTDEMVEGVIEGSEDCSGKSDAAGYTKRKMRACFGTNYTHTELLFMRPCGVILSRATLYGSEAISAVHLAAKATFPTKESTPEFLFYDSNCKLVAHQRFNKDSHFNSTAQPVDVFHFRTKHKESDTFCQVHCNPAAFDELLVNGKWRFNTSICEQTNVWLGGYMAILRNMEVARYNFYLDEMIKRRNRYMIQELERRGHVPWTVPRESFFPTEDVIMMS